MSTTDPHPDLPSALEKLTGSRAFLDRFKTPRWKPKTVHLVTGGIIKYGIRQHSHKGPHLPSLSKSVLVTPGGARLATRPEEFEHERSHVFVITAVAPEDEHSYTADELVLYFAAQTRKDARLWVDAVNHHSFDRMGGVTHLEAPILAAWGHVPVLPDKAIGPVMRALNFKASRDELEEAFRKVTSREARNDVRFSDFAAVMATYLLNDPIKKLINKQTGDSKLRLTPNQLAQILGCTESQATQLLLRRGADECSPDMLVSILFDPSNSIIDHDKCNEKHDMTRPLNEYIVSSSHNTYLVGDQLKSDSKAEMYRIVLERGCRCVEIDMWDGKDGQPVVLHGHTMTAEEKLVNVIRVIKENAFAHGYEYPLILSLENHLTKPQQIIAAKIMSEFFGDLVYHAEGRDRDIDVLPSPEDLKGKILIKAKTGLSLLRAGATSADGEAFTSGGEEDSDDSGDSDDSPGAVVKKDRRRPSISQFKRSAKGSKENASEPETKIVPEIAELTFLSGGNRKSLMGLWAKGVSGTDHYIASSCVSINEKKMWEIHENKYHDALKEYNSHGLTRVYPKGTRIDSSNYIPTLAHSLGCQVVALNWQRNDPGMAVNEARFLDNAGCGYLLSRTVVEPALPGTLSITLLSGFMLSRTSSSVSRDTMDPYCIIKAYDSVFQDADDYSSFKYSSQTVRSNGFCPTWDETIKIDIANRALAVIHFRVYDRDRTSDDDLMGYCAVPVAVIREGIRCLPLSSKHGDKMEYAGTPLRPSLLCEVKWE